MYTPSETVYDPVPLPPNAQRNFLAGAGEASPFHALHLQLEGVISVEGALARSVTTKLIIPNLKPHCSVSPRRHHVVFSTMDPPTVQKMPWPPQDDTVMPDGDYETWLLEQLELTWLVESDGVSFARSIALCE